jgi:hypothetical protein
MNANETQFHDVKKKVLIYFWLPQNVFGAAWRGVDS